jgi:hypothetical protein
MDLSTRALLEFYKIRNGFHKFKHSHAKHMLKFAVSIFRLKMTRTMSCYYYDYKRNTYIYRLGRSKIARFLKQSRIDSSSLDNVMQNILCSSLSDECLYANTQE